MTEDQNYETYSEESSTAIGNIHYTLSVNVLSPLWLCLTAVDVRSIVIDMIIEKR